MEQDCYTRNDIFLKIRDIISDLQDSFRIRKLNDCIITEDTTLEDLGMDSLDIVDFIVTLEIDFKVSIPDDYSIRNVGDAVDVIMELKNN